MTTSTPSSFTTVAEHEGPTVPGEALPAGMWPPASTLEFVVEQAEPVAASNIVVYAPPPIVSPPIAPNPVPIAEPAQAQLRGRVARRQAPFLIMLGVSTLVGGLALLAMGVLRLRMLGAVPVSPIYFRNMAAALVSGTLMVLGAGIGLAEVLGLLRK